MKEQYVIRKYWTPNDGELVTADDDREILLSEYELLTVIVALQEFMQSPKFKGKIGIDSLIRKLGKLESLKST